MPHVSDSGNSFTEDQESDGMYYVSFMRQMRIHTVYIIEYMSVYTTKSDNLVSL
jgi:hypothetical protein